VWVCCVCCDCWGRSAIGVCLGGGGIPSTEYFERANCVRDMVLESKGTCAYLRVRTPELHGAIIAFGAMAKCCLTAHPGVPGVQEVHNVDQQNVRRRWLVCRGM